MVADKIRSAPVVNSLRGPRLVFGAALLCLSLTAHSQAVWETLPQLDVSVQNDDNPRLQPDNMAQSDGGAVVDALVNLSTYSERSEFMVEPRVRTARYSNAVNSDLQHADTFLRASGRYTWQRAEFTFTSDLSDLGVRTSEILNATPVDPNAGDTVDTDTGVFVLYNETRRRSALRPSFELRMSERSSIVVDFRKLNVAYSGPVVRGRSDFNESRLEAGILRRAGNRNSVTAHFVASNYEADLSDNRTHSVGVEAVFVRPLATDWTLNLSVGVLRSAYRFLDDTTQKLIDNADSNPIFRVGFRRRTERVETNIDLIRRVNPSASGFLVRRDEIRYYVSRQMTPRVIAQAALRLNQTKSVANANPRGDRDYARLELGMYWAWTERVALNIGYHFTSQDFVNRATGQAESNRFFLGFNYHGLSQRPRL